MNRSYPFNLTPLSKKDGGGWMITYPDLPGCMSDGETPEEAIENGQDALESWITANQEEGRVIPGSSADLSGKFVVRVPRSLHARLVTRAESEGVSMNALVSSILSERVH